MMAYTNSSLVNYTKISPNKGNWDDKQGKRVPDRLHTIDTISIHCTAGQCTVETLGTLFAKESKQASSNYGIGYDGRIGMYVEEKDRSWCTSNKDNDNRAITIEVASDSFAPYAVKDAAYQSLIKLVADICKRNGIKKLLWKGDKSLIGQVDKQNMTVHRWFANKSCPGDYLYNLHGEIARKVNAILNPPVAATFAKGDLVEIKGTNYYSGSKIPTWVRNTKWYVYSVSGNRVVINKSQDGKYAIMSPVKASDLKKVNVSTPPKKSNEEVAREVIKGLWGNGTTRRNRLIAAGYDPDVIQKLVNKLLK